MNQNMNKFSLSSIDKLFLTTTDNKNLAPEVIFAIFPTKHWIDDKGIPNTDLELIQYIRKHKNDRRKNRTSNR